MSVMCLAWEEMEKYAMNPWTIQVSNAGVYLYVDYVN